MDYKNTLTKSAAALACCGIMASCAPIHHGQAYGGGYHSDGIDSAVPLIVGAAVVGGAIYAVSRHNDRKHSSHGHSDYRQRSHRNVRRRH